ncbi:MAG: hypothetical protein ACRDVF_09595 [Microbacterium sp.]|uniref:hypothetical protein n=1 Tax=Microbacterium sp. TaxID=51671 RepID=UPI003D6E21A3
MKNSMRRAVRILVAATTLSVGLTGCSPSSGGTQPANDASTAETTLGAGSVSDAPRASPLSCDGAAVMLTVDPLSATAGQTVSVSVHPPECLDELWAGEVIIRSPEGDLRTCSRLDVGATSVSVEVPPDLTGTPMLMLVPDLDCERSGATGDCHYPYAEIEIRAATP